MGSNADKIAGSQDRNPGQCFRREASESRLNSRRDFTLSLDGQKHVTKGVIIQRSLVDLTRNPSDKIIKLLIGRNRFRMARPIILILGAGRRTGLAIATRFYEAGFEPVMVSRQGNATGRFKAIKADLSDVKSVGKIFEEVRREGEPQVVIHNGENSSFSELLAFMLASFVNLSSSVSRALLTVEQRLVSAQLPQMIPSQWIQSPSVKISP